MERRPARGLETDDQRTALGKMMLQVRPFPAKHVSFKAVLFEVTDQGAGGNALFNG